jgi:hypothetical protein
MKDEVKWTIFGNYLADKFFPAGSKPDPDSLIELLQDLEVRLEKVEVIVSDAATHATNLRMPACC